nr:amino acid permease C-terminal domain-containing protein [Bacillus pumilus]
MLNLPGRTWLYFGVWLLIGVVMYAAYSNKHSELAKAS